MDTAILPARYKAPASRVAIVVVALLALVLVVRNGPQAGSAAAIAAARAQVDAGQPADSRAVTALTDRVLARDVTNPTAIEFRAVQAIAANDPARAQRLFALSGGISRRSLPTRLALIEQAVQREDFVGALDNFDIALRTSKAAPGTLFPILAAATTDPVLAPAIARVLDRNALWVPQFAYFAITQGGAAEGMAGVMLRMRERGAIRRYALDQTLIGQLVAERRFDAARRVQTAFNPTQATQSLLADPHFADPTRRFPFGWAFADRGEIGALRGAIDGRPALIYQAATGVGGGVASQLLMLPAGRYRLGVTTAEAAADPAALPVWTLTCAQQGGGQIALLTQPATRGAQGAADLTVPLGCTAQWLALTLRPSATEDGQSGAVAAVSVTRR